MTTGLYRSPQRTGLNAPCAGGGAPTRGQGNGDGDDAFETEAKEEEEGEEEEAFRLRAIISTAACPNKTSAAHGVGSTCYTHPVLTRA